MKPINDLRGVYKASLHELVDGKMVCVWRCPIYRAWQSMWRRFRPAYRELYPSYEGVTIQESWTLFSNFKGWAEGFEVKGKHLDKDIIGGVKGLSTYSEDTCAFVSKDLNIFFTDSRASRGEFPLGVSFDKSRGNFRSYISKGGRNILLGRFENPEDAHRAWQLAKYHRLVELIKAEDPQEELTKALHLILYLLGEDLRLERETETLLRRPEEVL